MTDEKRPKDMTQAELDALPECGPGGMRYEEVEITEDVRYRHPYGRTYLKPILERGCCSVKQMDDIAYFQGSDGYVYSPQETPVGWHKMRVPGFG